MKAVVMTEYGPPEVLKLQEVAKPTPKDNDVLIKIHIVSVTFGDLMARNMKASKPWNFTMPTPLWLPVRLMFGFRKPRNQILGTEFAGVIEAVGKDVTRFNPGDQVFGYRADKFGANAEYLCMPEDGVLAEKPANMSDEEAAVIPYGAITAMVLLRKGNIQPGHKVLINGASGSIGSAAVQLAKHYGAEVTGVAGTPRLEFMKALGADKVIDYTKEDFTKNGETYDLIFDIKGKTTFSRCKGSLKPNGRFLLASFKTRQLIRMLWTSLFGSKKVICAIAPEKLEDLLAVKALAEEGAIKAVIDKRFPLEQVADAHRYIEDGHHKGQIVINVA